MMLKSWQELLVESEMEKAIKKILVCLKQVPNTKDVKINPDTHALIREGMESILNPYDNYALGEALALKRKFQIKIETMTMGPPQAIEILKYSLYRGVDEAFLLSDKRLAGSDTWATAKAISALIERINYDVIFCGQESIDSGTGHIGISIAELLNIPQVNYVKKILNFNLDKIRVISKFDDCDAVIEAKAPVVLSFLKKDQNIHFEKGKNINLSNIKQFNINDLGLKAEEVGLDGSFTQVISIDIDDRFIGYQVISSNLKADKRIKLMMCSGIEEKEDRKIIKDLSKSSLEEVARLIK